MIFYFLINCFSWLKLFLLIRDIFILKVNKHYYILFKSQSNFMFFCIIPDQSIWIILIKRAGLNVCLSSNKLRGGRLQRWHDRKQELWLDVSGLQIFYFGFLDDWLHICCSQLEDCSFWLRKFLPSNS